MTNLVRSWSPLQWIAALAATVATAVLMAVPTGIIHTPLYTRMTPVLWWNYPRLARRGGSRRPDRRDLHTIAR